MAFQNKFGSGAPANTGFGPVNPASTAPFSFNAVTTSASIGFGAFGNTTGFGSGFGQATSKPLAFGGFGASAQGAGGVGQQNAFGSLFGIGSSTAPIGGNLGRPVLPVASTTFIFAGNVAVGSSNVGMSSSLNQVGSTITSQSQTTQQLTPYEELSRLISAWSPESIDCRFQSYFYNMVHPAEVQFYTQPPSMSQALWSEAQANNPDRTMQDIKKRLAVQEEITAKANVKFKEYGAKLEDMKRKHNLETLVRIEDRKRKHIELTQRVIKLMRRIQVLRLSGTLIRSDEEALKGRLEDIKQQLQRSSRKLETLKTQYNVTKLQWGVRESPVTHKFNAVNDNQLDNIIKVLDTEQTGIVHDIETLKKDSKDIDVILRHLNDVP
ncbi:2651_t:CDS:2 [Gigaspora margarita]|uniref:2651_t:CDS:1 n=1 Tax=Gigaspora margarita TaxID=4874 RepID=A0ABN7V172_GIGMA|nr:2651_t:CDS:2 [Gigaspora margarita]